MACWQEELDRIIQARHDETVALRRRLHMHPEVSGEEHKTSMFLYQKLGDEGYQVRLGPEGRGVIADLDPPDNGAAGGIFALRADIDALRIHDEKQVPYHSRRKGVMHACGHDGHTAVVTCVLSAIAELHRHHRLPFRPRVRGIFQPDEETCLGACHMIDAGALDGVQGVIAAHVDPSRTVGRIGLRKGVLTAYCNHMHVIIQGRGGHAARPHEARDPICAAAQFIQWLYQQIPRATDSQDAVVITVGMVHGGHMANVIPERVELEGTVRTLNRSVRDDTLEHIRRLADAVSVGTQTIINVNFGVGAQSVENDPELIDYLTEATRAVLGAEGVDSIARPSMGSEDFAFFSHRVPSAMFRLGCGSPRVGNAGLHTSLFDIDDDALLIGSRIMARAVLSWLAARAASDLPQDSHSA